MFGYLTWIVFPLLLLALSAPCVAQPAPSKTAADSFYGAQKYEDAAKAYEAIVQADPANAQAWYRLGMSRFALQQFEPAIQAFQKNVALKNNPVAMYNIACAYARLNQKDKAIEWLTKAVGNQLPPQVNLVADPDLSSLSDDPRFKAIVTAQDKTRRPCMYSNRSREFDFWVGQWDVFNPQGQKAGTSVIENVAEGCGILESWKSSVGLTGKSINFYDPQTQKWYQYWIGPNGTPTRYSGVYGDGAMRYEAEPTTVNGTRTLHRLTFFKLDSNTVRQFAEQSTDDGKTWTTVYDFKYVRKS